jgi:opacity protein-like surface antigen
MRSAPALASLAPILATSLGLTACTAPGSGAQRRLWEDADPIAARYAKAVPASAGFRAKEGYFVGGMAAAATMEDDDLDGTTALVSPSGNEAAVAPDLGGGYGWGISIGYRGETDSLQYTYNVTEHDSESTLTSGDDLLKCYSLDFKHHFNVDGRFQPFLMLGVTVPRLTVEDGSIDTGTLTSNGNAKFQGLGLNAGGGAALYVSSRIALFGEAFYRWAYFNEVDTKNEDGNIRGDIDASGFGARAGVLVTF